MFFSSFNFTYETHIQVVDVVFTSSEMLHFSFSTSFISFFFHAKKLECQKKCANLVTIETKEESDWMAATFLNGNFVFELIIKSAF